MRRPRRVLCGAWLVASLLAPPAWAATPQPGLSAPTSGPTPEPPGAPAAPADPAAPSEPMPEPAKRVAEDVQAGRFGSAVFRCERAGVGGASGPPTATTEAASQAFLRPLCARAYLGLGDKLAAAGARAEARARWSRASELDPRLLDDPRFLVRLRDASPASPRPTATQSAPPPHHEHLPPGARAEAPASAGTGVGDAARRTDHTDSAGDPAPRRRPRDGRTLGVGLSTGVDGLLALSLAWIYRGRVSFEVSAGLLYRTLDTRVRFYGAHQPLSPVLGLGLVTPFGAYGQQGRAGVRVARYESLYRVGQAAHVDLGLSWAVGKLDLFGGVAFLTSLDQRDDLRLLFFPQYAVQALFCF